MITGQIGRGGDLVLTRFPGMGLFSKLFPRGNAPDELQVQLESENLVYLARKAGVSQRFSGSVPGLFSGASRTRGTGMLAITGQRVYATLPSAPRLKVPAIDQRWDADQTGPAKVTFSEDGVQLDLDVGHVDPRFHGHLTLHYKKPLTEGVLAQLPSRTLAFTVPPEYVFHLLGVRAKT
jgi:hypothetical protein